MANVPSELERVFPGDSIVAGLMREFDWSRTSLGSPSAWAPELRTAVGVCLLSDSPMQVLWGPTLTLLYNDASTALLSAGKHPKVLGRTARDAWNEIWHLISPSIDRAISYGEGEKLEKILLPGDRTSHRDDALISLSLSPILGQTGETLGLFLTCAEMRIGDRTFSDYRRYAEHQIKVARDDAEKMLVYHEAERAEQRKEMLARDVSLTQYNRDLADRLKKLETANSEMKNSHRAALNLMEDAILARSQAQNEIAERSRAESALRESEERMRTLFNSMNEAFVVKEAILDEQGAVIDYRFLECNPAFASQTGLGDPRGHTVLELMPNVERIWFANYESVIRTGKPCRFEVYIAQWDRWLSVSASRIGGEGSLRIAIVFTDVTERKRADEKIAAAEEHLRLVLESVREYAIFSTDIDRKITSWNKGAERLLGYAEHEILGRSADVIFTEEDRAAGACEQEVGTAVKNGRAADERWHVKKDGSRFWGSGAMMAMHDVGENVVGFVKVFRDETQNREAKEKLEVNRAELVTALQETQRAREEAEAANQAKDHFLAVLSHELRTPLSPVIMTAMTLQRRKNLDASMTWGLDIIRRNVETECKLIDDLLDITRISRGRIDIAREPMHIHESLLRAVEIAKPDIESKGQNLTLNFSATNDEFLGDTMRLEQTFWNLLKNASKFTPFGGQIQVSSALDSGNFQVKFTDTGEGIAPEKLRMIFDAFIQADESIAKKFGGLGLGLAIAKATVDAHGGKITAQSAGMGHGATFTVDLPLSG